MTVAVVVLSALGVLTCAALGPHLSSLPGCYTPGRAARMYDPDEERWL